MKQIFICEFHTRLFVNDHNVFPVEGDPSFSDGVKHETENKIGWRAMAETIEDSKLRINFDSESDAKLFVEKVGIRL